MPKLFGKFALPDLPESKPERQNRIRAAAGYIPVPRTLGSFVILVTALAFFAGWIRNELALTLLGTVFLVILVYCFLGIFCIGLIHRRKLRSLSMTIVSEKVTVGTEAELNIKTNNGVFWSFPAILVRCELNLETKDGRVIRHFINPSAPSAPSALLGHSAPGFGKYSNFPVKERGAYYGENDRFAVFDAMGFFRFSLPVPQTANPRLFAVPLPAEEIIPITLKSGGSEQRNEPHYRKSDDHTDHRPYVPGDDPRRINWKLYSHTPTGELLVREGEPEPPPRSRLLILIDTEVDGSLYTIDEGRRAVDLLCESALAAALEFSSRGMDVCLGFSGGRGTGEHLSGSIAELSSALAWPAAVFWPRSADLPQAPNDRAVLILSLPRNFADQSALDRFLKNRGVKQEIDIVFISKESENLEDAARTCVNIYNGRSGVHAARVTVSPSRERPGAQ